MKSLARALTLLAALVLAIMQMAPAQTPLSARTWVSGVGNDANACSIRTTPCRTFAGALLQTAAFGEINCLDPGNFGIVTIKQSLSIVCEEETGHVLAQGGDTAIKVNVGASDVVTLRGLDIEGAGTGDNGIEFAGGGTLHVQEVLIRNFTQNGIYFAPTVGTVKLHVSDETLISDCGGTNPNVAGIAVFPFVGNAAVVTINGAQLRGNSNGILVNTAFGHGIANVHVRDTIAASSINHGMSITTFGGIHAGATIDRSTFLFNGGDGLKVEGVGAIAIIGGSTISGNLNLGVEAAGGATLLSHKDNHIAGNVSDGTPIPAFAGPDGQPLQ